MADEMIQGWKIDLSEGRHVFVAEDGDCFLVEFLNSAGERTRIKLSREAANALRYLLGSPVERDDIIKKIIMHMATAAEQTASTLAWQEVKPDTLPMAEPTP